MRDILNEGSDVFSEFADRLELDQALRAAEERSKQLIKASYNQIIELGSHAVNAGMTSDQLLKDVWNTVTRHRELMTRTGGVAIGPQFSREKARYFKISSKAVPISTDMAIVLGQQSSLPHDSNDFWETLERVGMQTALDSYAMPATTIATLIARRSGQHVHSIPLSPRESQYVDEEFDQEWGKHMLALLIPEFDAPIRVQDRSTVGFRSLETIDPKDLIVGAGYNARFNLILDEIAAHI